MTAPVRTIEERGGAWLRLVLDRPPANLLSLEVIRALAVSVESAAGARPKWLTIEGAGVEFSFGALIQEHVPGPMEQVLSETAALLRRLLAAPCATAALVRGRCLGGAFELALACDTIIAEEGATMGLPEIALAAFPPAAAVLLPLRVGASRAADAMLTGASRSAAEWHACGAVPHLVPPGGLPSKAGAWFDAHLAPRSAPAIAAAAEASRLLLREAAGPALDAAHRLYIDRILPTHDAAEGVRAFLEKRQPRWTDR